MKRIYTILFGLSLLLVFGACNNKDRKTGEVNEQGLPVFAFTNDDSIAVRQLAQNYVDCFNAKNFEQAAEMLYTVKNDSVYPLTAEQRQGYLTAMNALPFRGSAIKEQTLRSDLDNEVRIALLMAEDGDLETEKGTINFFLNPVFIDGQWYLTILDKYAEGVGLYH